MPLAADDVARSNVRAWELLAHAVPGAWVRREGGALGVVTHLDLGGFNGVWGEERDLDPPAVARLLDAVAAAGVPHCLQLRPGWPAEIDVIASERGLVRVPGEPVMVLEGDAVVADAGGLTLRQLEPQEGAVHARVAASAGLTRKEAAYRNVVCPEVLGVPGLRCYVGEVRGVAVTTAIGVTAGESVGIFSVATLPSHRGRGYGGAVTARAARDGFAAGARWAWLAASEAGYPLYRRMGFVTLERLDFWESRVAWHAQPEKAVEVERGRVKE